MIKPKVLIPLATLCLIFIPMLTMSILMKAFWIDSQYDFPFVTIPAVLIGDPLVLPPLNYHIYLALRRVLPFLKRKTIFLTVGGSFFVSLLMNSYTHYLWSHDAFTGFMDPQYGVLSTAGWWHFVISVTQIAIIFIFAVFWILTVRQQDQETFKAFEKAVYILMIFNLVNFSGGFVDKDLFLTGRVTPDLAVTSIINASLPVVTSIVLLWQMRKIHQATQSGSKQ
jgi:hypothetical protein